VAAESPAQLTEAIAAIRTGDRHRAREILSRLLRSDSSNSEYWIWMSTVVDTPRERIYCLESALRIDPTNRAAMRGLTILSAREPSEAEIAQALRPKRREFDPIQPAIQKTVEQAPGPEPSLRESPFAPRRGGQFLRFLSTALIGAAVIIIIAGVTYFVAPMFRPRFFGAASTLPPASPTATDTPLPGTPTATPLPAATRIIRTPVPLEVAATPLSLLVDATATATPVAGFTPHPSYEAYGFGVKAMQEDDYEQAIFFLQQVVDDNPEWADALYFLGKAQRLAGDIAGSIKSLDMALKLDQDFAPAYLERGRTLLLRDELAAERDFFSAIDKDPGFVEAYEELGTYYAERRLWQRLETYMQRAVDEGAGSPRVLIYLSEAKLNLLKYDDALDFALEGSADDPTMLDGYLAVGKAYVALGNYTLEDAYFTQAIWPLQTYTTYRPDDHQGWTALGSALLGIDQIDAALTALNRALDLNDRYAPAYLARGRLYTRLGQYEVAHDDLLSARRYGPETFELRLALAQVLYHLGGYQEALADYLAPAISETNQIKDVAVKERRLAEAYAIRALIFETNPDNLSDAIRHWQWVLELENALPQTRELAQTHYDELTGVGPTRTPTSSPTPTPTPTPEGAEPTPSPSPTPAP